MKKLWKNIVIIMMVFALVGIAPILTIASELFATQEPVIVKTEDVKVTASYSMFKVDEDAKLYTYSDGSMRAEITYTGSSFLKMYLGKAEAASTATEGIYEAQKVGENYVYTIPISALDTEIDAAVLSSKGNWKDNTIKISFAQEPVIVKTEDVKVTASYSMFKVAEDAKLYTYSDGSMRAEITYTGSSFLKMYLGKAEAASTATEGIYEAQKVGENYVYTIPISALDTEIDAAVLSSKGNWKDNTLTISLPNAPEPDPDPEPTPDGVIPADGIYTIDVISNASMFKVVACLLYVKDKEMVGVVALSGTGYDYLYMGNGAQAIAAGAEQWIPYQVGAEGKYVYTIPVLGLDKEIAVASHSKKNDTWYDRTLTFDSSTLKPYVPDQPAGDEDEEDEPSAEDVGDGSFVPSFSYTGGTGRVTISCKKVTMQNGKAIATIVFSSPNYTYVKVNGVKYYNENKGGNSTFKIPVNLNGETPIAAETTAMGSPYEIEYVLYVYVDGTDASLVKEEHTKDTEKSKETTKDATEQDEKEENGWGEFGSDQDNTAETESEDSEQKEGINIKAVVIVVIVLIVLIFAGCAVVITRKKKRG